MQHFLTSFVARLFFQLPDLLLFVQMMSQCSHTNGMISWRERKRETLGCTKARRTNMKPWSRLYRTIAST